MKMTPWFSAKTRPVRSGNYEVKYVPLDRSPCMRFFDAEDGIWKFSRHGDECLYGNIKEDLGRERWRGLATKDGK